MKVKILIVISALLVISGVSIVFAQGFSSAPPDNLGGLEKGFSPPSGSSEKIDNSKKMVPPLEKNIPPVEKEKKSPYYFTTMVIQYSTKATKDGVVPTGGIRVDEVTTDGKGRVVGHRSYTISPEDLKKLLEQEK